MVLVMVMVVVKSVFMFAISKNKTKQTAEVTFWDFRINNFRPWNGWIPAQKLGLAFPFPIFFVVSGWKFAGWFPTPDLFSAGWIWALKKKETTYLPILITPLITGRGLPCGFLLASDFFGEKFYVGIMTYPMKYRDSVSGHVSEIMFPQNSGRWMMNFDFGFLPL